MNTFPRIHGRCLKCIEMHLGGHIYSKLCKSADGKAAEKHVASVTVRSRLTVLTAGHEREHTASRAEIGGCVSSYTYISRMRKPSECVWKLEQKHPSGTNKYSPTQAQDRQARDRRAEAVCSRCSSSRGCRQITRWSLVCVCGRKTACGRTVAKYLGHSPESPMSKAAWSQSRKVVDLSLWELLGNKWHCSSAAQLSDGTVQSACKKPFRMQSDGILGTT